MRLIDADALKKCAIPCEIHNGASTDLCVPLYQIDNAPTVDPKDYKWFDCIDNKLLKSRHGDFVIYKVDFLLDNLTREVFNMEGARRMKPVMEDDNDNGS